MGVEGPIGVEVKGEMVGTTKGEFVGTSNGEGEAAASGESEVAAGDGDDDEIGRFPALIGPTKEVEKAVPR